MRIKVSCLSNAIYCAMAAFVLLISTVPANGVVVGADMDNGVFTADVTISTDSLFGGDSFPAVINPDASHADKVVPTNESGLLFGDYNAPLEFQYTELPVYAIVDSEGTPWNLGTPLYGAGGLSDPLFNLLHVGNLTMMLQRSVVEGGGYEYVTEGGAYFSLVGEDLEYTLAGSVQFDLPPSGVPGYLWYGVGPEAIDMVQYESGESYFSMMSSDNDWLGEGWPGATLDKNFFPGPVVPEPSVLFMAVLGLIALRLFRRR